MTTALCGAMVVLSLDPPEVASVDVVVAGGRVAGLGAAPLEAVRRDYSGHLIVPGNVCAHHHLYSSLARGMPYSLAPPGDFGEILSRIWWRLDRAHNPESVQASARRGGLEALLAGTTTIVDHHASPNFIDGSLDVVAAQLEELGVRSVLCYEVTDRDGLRRAAAGVEENRRFARHQRPLTRGMVGAHASFTMSDDTLAACADAAAAVQAGVHIHVAEDGLDERDSMGRYGKRVAQRLADLGVLTGEGLLAHCVHVHPDEVRQIDAAGATVVCNPCSNMNNGVGYSPFNLRPGRVALGTDGIGGDMIRESQAGYFRARELTLDADPSWPLTRMAESARLAGRVFGEPLLGTLHVGAPADLCVLDYDPPAPLTEESLAGHWVFGLTSGLVRDVYVAGERVVADGRSTRVDQARAASRDSEAARALWQRMEEIPPHPYLDNATPMRS
ncbi:MAG TPA: amidohydrolase family protein [Acidimicrobiales bacterium]|nr:amidohydrolase family protein [Acidimicrobiales bacterium]